MSATRREDRVESIDRMFECPPCGEPRRVAVVYRETADGGEVVILRCTVCQADYPSAYVTPRGRKVQRELARARGRKPSASRTREIERLERQMSREVSRAYSAPGGDDGEAHDVRSTGSDRVGG